jgi:hypothetical protein
VDCFLAKNLALQLLLAHAFHLTDKALDLGLYILVEILLRDDGRFDFNEVVIAPTRMDLLRAAFAV